MEEVLKKPRGRPPKAKYDLDFVIGTMYDYIQDNELPIFKEVCYLNNWNCEYIYQMAERNEELSNTIKMLSNKKECELERGGLNGKYNKTMAVFSLKQLGWKDRIEVETSGTTATDKAIKVEFVNNADTSK